MMSLHGVKASESPLFHLEESIRTICQLTIVGRYHQRHALFGTDPEEELMELLGGIGVQIASGLVGQDHDRAVGQSPRHRNPLLLPTTQGTGSMAESLAEPHGIEELSRSVLGLPRAFPGNQERHHNILQRRKLPQEMVELEDETDPLVSDRRQRPVAERRERAAFHQDLTGGRAIQSAEEMQQG
jgi:hypothetical protein